MNKKLLVLFVVIAILTVVFIGGRTLPKGFATADSDPMNHTISVTGEGYVEVVPDVSYLNFGVFFEDPDPAKAMDGLAIKANGIMDILLKQGIAKEKIKTTNLNLSPIYSYNPQTGKSTLEGYRASENFLVETKIEEVGRILSAIVKAGVNDIGGISFDVSNKEDLKLKAIENAMQNAREKADASLKNTNYKVTGIKSISIESINYPQPIFKSFMAGQSETNVPVQGGTLKVNVNVQVVFTFD
ncbi:MAG: SIMPL domain-containing protein [Caldisericum exile]